MQFRSIAKQTMSARIVSAIWMALSVPLWAQVAAPAGCSAIPPKEYLNYRHVPVTDSWFAVYEVAPAVFAIYEPQQAEKTISYLLVGARQALLFDTGMGIGNIKNVTAELTRLRVIVLNSHTHNDHAGGNWQFDTIYGIDTDFTRLKSYGSRDDAQAEITPSQICGKSPATFNRDTYATRPWKTRQLLHDGERIDLGGRVLEVIATPGHTPDSICLLDSAAKLLFTGDTYYPGTVWLYRPETDLDAYQTSVKRLAMLVPNLKMILGAHNIPTASPTVLLQLLATFEEIRSHKITAEPAKAGKVVYKSGGVAFLMRAPAATP